MIFYLPFFFLQIASGVEYELPKFVETNDKKTMDPTQLLWHRNIPESLVIIGGVFFAKTKMTRIFSILCFEIGCIRL